MEGGVSKLKRHLFLCQKLNRERVNVLESWQGRLQRDSFDQLSFHLQEIHKTARKPGKEEREKVMQRWSQAVFFKDKTKNEAVS